MRLTGGSCYKVGPVEYQVRSWCCVPNTCDEPEADKY